MPIPRLVIGMAVPLMLSLLVQSLYNIVDSIFVARIGETALTATSLAYPVQILMIALAVGTSVGINALLSRLLGARQLDEVRQATTTGLLLSVASSLVFVLPGLFAVPSFVSFMTDNPQTAEYCAGYLRICMLLCTGTFLETMAQRFLQAAGNTTLSMLSLIVGAGTNIILDPIMIFGCFGFPALGIRGAAIAVGIGLIGTVAFMQLPRQLLSLFSASEEMLAFGVPAIRIICVTFALAAITIILGYSASGLGNGTINMMGTGLRQVVLLVPFAALFLKLGGINMVWYAMWISELCAMLYCIFAIRRELSRKVKPLCNKA